MARLQYKLQQVGKRAHNFIMEWPRRIKRLLFHFTYLIPSINYRNPIPPQHILDWFIFTILYILDILGIPEIYETTLDFFKWNSRRLTGHEANLAKTVFGINIKSDLIVVDDKASYSTGRHAFAYVSFNTINFHKEISDDIFVHELVHVWQYQNFGSIYIYKALLAQKSKEGYDYGGVEKLYVDMLAGKNLVEYNFEQQAEIIQDYFNLSMKPLSQNAAPLIPSIYKHFHLQLQIENTEN